MAQSCSTDLDSDALKMSLPGRQVVLWDDWWAHRQNEPLSVVREEWSKIRSSMKIARWNLRALWQWSACSAVNVSLSLSFSILTFCKPFLFHPSHVLFPPSNFSFHLCFHFTVCFCSETSFVLLCVGVFPLSPSFLASCTVTCPSSSRDAYRGSLLSSDVVYSGGAHTCISWQGWVCNYPVPWHWLEREAMSGRVAGCHKKKKKWWIKDEREQKK